MKTEVLFEEVQGSGRKGSRDFLKGITAMFTGALVFNLVLNKGNINPLSVTLGISIAVCVLVIILSAIRMITQVRTDGLYVRFAPFQTSFRRYGWNDMEELYLRKYDAFREYSGWGIRYGPMGTGYIFAGDAGIQMIFHNKSKVLIGTQKPEEILKILSRIGKLA